MEEKARESRPDSVEDDIARLRKRIDLLGCCYGVCDTCRYAPGLKKGMCSHFEKSLADSEFDMEARDHGGATPMLAAAQKQSTPAPIAAFVQAGANVFARDYGGRSLLHCAILNDNATLTKWLLGCDYLTSDVDGSGFTLLESALLESKSPEVLRLLLEKQRAEHVQLAKMNPNPAILDALKEQGYATDGAEGGEDAPQAAPASRGIPDGAAAAECPCIYGLTDTLLNCITRVYAYLREHGFIAERTFVFEVPFRRVREALDLTENEAALFCFIFANYFDYGEEPVSLPMLAGDAEASSLRFLGFWREFRSLEEKGFIAVADTEENIGKLYARQYYVPEDVIARILGA